MSFRKGWCRSCGTPVIWATTGTKLIPIDADVTPTGNIRLEPRAHGAPLAILVDAPASGLRLPHFATCPHADAWRKR